MTLEMKHCGGCDTDKPLTEFGFYKNGRRVGTPFSQCKKCEKMRGVIWRRENRVRRNKQCKEYRYRLGAKPASENKSCAAYLGCVIAETVLSHEFPGFVRMPNCNPGYDYECPKGFKVDVKSGCRQSTKSRRERWTFNINKNKVANYFLFLAFNTRELLTPEHIWLISGDVVNAKTKISITDSPKSIAKWSKYERSLENVLKCCNELRDD